MNANNNATTAYTTPPVTPERPTPPELERKKRVAVRKTVDFTARKKMRNFLERPDTDGAELDGLAEFALLAAAPAAAAPPATAPAPAAGADDA